MVTRVVAIACLSVLAAGWGHAATSCYTERYKAWGKYVACENKAVAAKVYGTLDFPFPGYQTAAAKCRAKYANVWAKVQAKFAGDGSVCDGPRFVESGGVVTDHLTRLEWALYAIAIEVGFPTARWTTTTGGTAADGQVWQALADANGSGFAGESDWRVPSRTELQTILLPESYPCASDQCVAAPFATVIETFDAGYDFGVTGPRGWTSTSSNSLTNAWFVSFVDGTVLVANKWEFNIAFVVRAGL